MSDSSICDECGKDIDSGSHLCWECCAEKEKQCKDQARAEERERRAAYDFGKAEERERMLLWFAGFILRQFQSVVTVEELKDCMDGNDRPAETLQRTPEGDGDE